MGEVRFEARVSAPSQVVSRALEGELVLLNLETETYFGLDEVGTRMWEVLTACPSIEGAYDQLASEYAIDAATLRRDLADLVEDLVRHGLVELDYA